MSAESLAASLGLLAQPHGDAGEWRLLSPTGHALYILSPRGAYGGGRRWALKPVLDLAAVATERAA